MSSKTLVLFLIFAVLIFPFFIVSTVQKEEPALYTFRAHIIEPLESSYSVYRYFLAEAVEGTYPDAEVILVINMIHTEGELHTTRENNEVWIKGRLLTEDDLCEKHYVYPDHAHIYALQVKTSILWPDQIALLKALYKSPVATLPVPSYILFYLLLENPSSHTPQTFFILLVKTLLMYVTIFLVIAHRTKKWNLLLILLIYTLLAMILTVPELLY